MRTLSGYVENQQGVRLAGCPVVFINRIKEFIPNASPARLGYYVVASTATDDNGAFSIDVSFSGPLIAVSWDATNDQFRPIVIGPIVG